MNWRPMAYSACLIALVVLIWEFSAEPLDRMGLAAFDPLDRICLVFVVLSFADAILTRLLSRPHGNAETRPQIGDSA